MATIEEIQTLLRELEKAPPSENFQRLDSNAMGIQAILKCLSGDQKELTAGEISEKLQVSTARTAVLLKKMVAKDYIKKKNDPNDGRIVMVSLTEHGEETARLIEKEIYDSLGEMIDKIGMERMLEFAEISKEIHSLIKKPELDL